MKPIHEAVPSPAVGSLRGPALETISERILLGTRDVAEEGDRWFLGAIRGIDQGLRWSKAGAASVATRAASGWTRLRALLPRRSARERIVELLETEAAYARLDPAAPEFRAFSENMATLIDCALRGEIQLEDIGFAFEDGPPTEAAGGEGETGRAGELRAEDPRRERADARGA